MQEPTLSALHARLSSEAPAIALRELLEAAAGRKCSRVEVGSEGVRRLRALAVEFGFGLALGRRKVVLAREPHKGDWSDRTVEIVPLDDPRGYFAVYLGPTDEVALLARDAEEELGDDAFGELLGIPPCCRAFYRDRRTDALAIGNDYLPLTLGVSGTGPFPAGANIVAQYFDAALLSHYPCSLHCEPTRQRTARTLAWLTRIAPFLAFHMQAGHHASYIVVPHRGIIQVSKGQIASVVGSVSQSEAQHLVADGKLTVQCSDVW